MPYTDVFGGSTVQPSDVQFASVALTASIPTDWPQFATTTQPLARIMEVSASVAALTVMLPDATLVSAGQDVLFDNAGLNTFTVLDNTGGTVATITPGQVKYLYLADSSTAAGSWRVTAFGSTSSAADASQLAGYGLKATSATISAAPLVTGISSNTTVVAADRAKVFVWTGVSGTLTLPTTSGSTADFAIEVRNQGTGTLTIAPVGGVLIDSALSITLSVNESCFVHMGATDWYTVGRGRNTNFNFTQLAKAVTGGTTALTLTESSNVVQTYTGVLLSNQTITLPAVVQVYYVRNNTTGAYTFTFACAAGGSTVTVAAAQAAILFCDGTNIINANTSLAGGITALLFGAGSATVPSAAFGASNNGLYAPALNEVGMTINGSQVGKWTSAGYTGTIVSTVAAAAGITSATTTVTTGAATAPTAGQVLTAINSTSANWQTPIISSSIIYAGRTSNTMLGVTQKGYLIDITSGTFSQTLDAAATLGNGWWCYVRNTGTGVITIDPSAAETINGAATYTLTAGSNATIQCDGTTFRTVVVVPNQLVRLPIFSADAATATAVSTLETMENGLYDALLGTAPDRIIFGNSLFIVSGDISLSNVSSSPDGVTWTLRAMPSSQTWSIGTDGTARFVASVRLATTIANSTNGTGWSAATALPGTSSSSGSTPVFNGSICMVVASAATTVYTSSDNGVTWGTQTTPATGTKQPWVVGGLFMLPTSATQYYTSVTGATGSWTIRNFPVASGNFTADGDGSAYCFTAASNYFRTTDGINWTDLGFGSVTATYAAPTNINGVYANFTAIFGTCGTRHSGLWVKRSSTVILGRDGLLRNTGATAFVGVTGLASGKVLRIAPTESTAATALFTR